MSRIRKNTKKLSRNRINRHYKNVHSRLFGSDKNISCDLSEGQLRWEELDAMPSIEIEDC